MGQIAWRSRTSLAGRQSSVCRLSICLSVREAVFNTPAAASAATMSDRRPRDVSVAHSFARSRQLLLFAHPSVRRPPREVVSGAHPGLV